jgi:hypothetical protein
LRVCVVEYPGTFGRLEQREVGHGAAWAADFLARSISTCPPLFVSRLSLSLSFRAGQGRWSVGRQLPERYEPVASEEC